jgi:hypothetical protein
MHDQRTIQRVAAAIDQARRDQGVRIDVAGTDRLAARIHDRHRIARLEPVQRRARHIDFVAEHPQMAGAQAPFLAALEHQDRIIGWVTVRARPRQGAKFSGCGARRDRDISVERSANRHVSNRLAGESSLYLRQHADNPVDWWPWGAEALSAGARRAQADPALDRLLGLPLVPRDGAR